MFRSFTGQTTPNQFSNKETTWKMHIEMAVHSNITAFTNVKQLRKKEAHY